ncbi:MAG: alpha/beta fold hydrolase [Burkholderiaceae bacterium]
MSANPLLPLSAEDDTTAPRVPALKAAAGHVDRHVRAGVATATAGLSPASLLLASIDWALHLYGSPGKRAYLAWLAIEQSQQYLRMNLAPGGPVPGTPDARPGAPMSVSRASDRRFSAEPWEHPPFRLLRDAFQLAEQWWHEATHGVHGVSPHHENIVAFAARQWLDLLCPGNYLATNPVVMRRTAEQGGLNLVRGAINQVEDLMRQASGAAPAGVENFVVGRDVATTPGTVVLRNRLLELIQYTPVTAKVHPEPVLIVPAWIMKYYILDLSPHNSLIGYLVSKGHTVFCISWKNPGPEDRDLGMDDYLESGFFAALDTVRAIVPGARVHATGYCLGGTLLAIAAAAMARDGDDRLASMTLFAAQTDFSEPGELSLFIDPSAVAMLEAKMSNSGYLTGDQMAGAFQMLRSYDLLWSRLVDEYLMGERSPLNDLMAWNADTTRLPARMQSQYLRRLFLNDDLSEGRYPVGGRPVALSDVSLPTFCVGTVSDHVAPWRSVHKLHYLSLAEITFVLTAGGHNAGIVSEPGRPRRHYQVLTRPAGGSYISPDDWLALAPRHEGSWWPEWSAWLKARSGKPVSAPAMGAPVDAVTGAVASATAAASLAAAPPPGQAAPGLYVLER